MALRTEDRLDQPADGEQPTWTEPVRDDARQRRGQRRDRLREQQQPDRCGGARGPLHVQEQASRRHRVAERADGLSRQQSGQPSGTRPEVARGLLRRDGPGPGGIPDVTVSIAEPHLM